MTKKTELYREHSTKKERVSLAEEKRRREEEEERGGEQRAKEITPFQSPLTACEQVDII